MSFNYITTLKFKESVPEVGPVIINTKTVKIIDDIIKVIKTSLVFDIKNINVNKL